MTTNFKLDITCVERDKDRSSFLQACSNVDLRAIRHLIDVKGVDPGAAVDQIGQNCLHYLVCSVEQDVSRKVQLMGYLISSGADPNAIRTTDGWTPLFLAALFGESRLVVTLLQNGAKVTIKDHEGLTAENVADKYRMDQVKNLLVHNRSKVPHSRFSCVQRGPALEPVSPVSPVSTSSSTEESTDTPISPPSQTSSSPPSLAMAEAAAKDPTEATLLTAQ